MKMKEKMLNDFQETLRPALTDAELKGFTKALLKLDDLSFIRLYLKHFAGKAKEDFSKISTKPETV